MKAGYGKLYAGFDLGGTKISMSIIDESGDVVARSRADASGNISAAGGAEAAGVVISLLARSGYLPDIDAMCFAVAGYSNEEELYNFKCLIEHELSCVKKFYYMPDYEIFFQCDWDDFLIESDADVKDQLKIIVISGTGSVVIAKGVNAIDALETKKIFGRGPVASDPGSGVDLGLKFIRRLTLDYELGVLDKRIADIAAGGGFDSLDGLIDSMRPKAGIFKNIAALAPLMLKAAETADNTPYFEDTLISAKTLSSGVKYLVRNFFQNYIDKPIQILFNGSVILKSDFYKNILRMFIKNYIESNIEFYDAREDVSTICARYSLFHSVSE